MPVVHPMRASLPPLCRPFVWSDLQWLSAAWGALIEKYGLMHSTYSATNNLLFCEKHGYYLFEYDPPFLIEPLPDRNRMIPTRFPGGWDSAFFEVWFGKPCTLYPVAEGWLPSFPVADYNITYSDAESDYLYHTHTLESLKGRHLSSRRNLLHQLEKEHTISLKPLTTQTQHDAKGILDRWQEHYTQQHHYTSDYLSCCQALHKLPYLPLTGQVAYAEEKPIGFYLGELLSPHVYLLHFLKELPSLHGVVPFLYQACARSQPETVQWINLEPDLGISGLRQAKQAYQPARLLCKWEIKKR